MLAEDPVEPVNKTALKKDNKNRMYYEDLFYQLADGDEQEEAAFAIRDIPGPSPRVSTDEGYDVERFNRTVYEVQEFMRKLRESAEVLQIYVADTSGQFYFTF